MVAIRDLFFVASITLLVAIGGAITLQSGLNARERHRGLGLLGNLSKMVSALIGSAVVLLLVHDWMGYRLRFAP